MTFITLEALKTATCEYLTMNPADVFVVSLERRLCRGQVLSYRQRQLLEQKLTEGWQRTLEQVALICEEVERGP